MSSSLRRGALAATAAFSMIPLAACGAGFETATDLVSPINAHTEVEDIQIQNVNVVMNDEGAAAVSGRIFNGGSEDQMLLAITVPGSDEEFDLLPAEDVPDADIPEEGAAELPPAEDAAEIVVPARGSVALGGEDNPAAFIEDAEAAGITLGNAQQLSFNLSDSGSAELHATVVPAGDDRGAFAYYEDFGPDVDRYQDEGSEESREEGISEDLEEAEDTDGPPEEPTEPEAEDDDDESHGPGAEN